MVDSNIHPPVSLCKIYKTNNGTEEVWVTSDEESKRITRTTMDKDVNITIYTLFELPKESEIIEVLFS